MSDPRACPGDTSLCEAISPVSCEEITCAPLKARVDNSVMAYSYQGCYSAPEVPSVTSLEDHDPDSPSDDPEVWDTGAKSVERLSLELCGRLCRMRGEYGYIGLGRGGCLCKAQPPAILTTPRDEAQCTTPCPGDENQMCGHTEALSIYKLSLGLSLRRCKTVRTIHLCQFRR